MRKFGVLAALLALLMLIVPLTAAQDMPMICGGLSESDCADLYAYNEANAAVDSAAFDISLDMSMSVEGQNIDFSISGSGAYAGVAMLTQIAAENPMAFATGDGLVDLVKNFDGDLDVTINLPALMAGEGAPETINLHAVLVDGIGYIDFDALATTIPDVPFTGWGGIDIAALVAQFAPMMESMTDMSGMTGGMDAETMAQFADPAFAESFIRIERAVDIAAVFRYTFDFGALMQSEVMQDLIEQQMETMGTDTAGVDMDMILAMYEDMTASVQVQYNGETQLMERITLDLALDMSSMGVSGTVELNMNINYSGHDATVITAPEGAQIAPPEMLFGGMSS